MTDVFISYKREERESARRIAEALTAHGFGVWWDADILPGEQYRAVTLQILQSCRAAIVIWSPKSILSSWVLDEATRAMERGVLVPVQLEAIPDYPLGFGQLHTHDCTEWDGGPGHASFAPVVAAVRRLVGTRGEAAAIPATSADAEAEVAFWRGVQESREASYFEAYLERYPNGLFVELARQRLQAIGAARAPRKRTSPPARKRKTSASAAVKQPAPPASAAPEPPPSSVHRPGLPSPGFTGAEFGYIATIALIGAFLAWPIANRAHGNIARAFYPAYQDYVGDIPLLFSFSTPQNIFLMTPLLLAFAWGYDRAAAWWAAKGRWPNALVIAVGAVLAVLFFLSLSMRNNDARETHFVLWLTFAWLAAVTARPATLWIKARLPEVMRVLSGPSQPPPR